LITRLCFIAEPQSNLAGRGSALSKGVFMDKQTLESIFSLIKEGKRNREIAHQLNVHPKRVSYYKRYRYNDWLQTSKQASLVIYKPEAIEKSKPQKVKKDKEKIFIFYGSNESICELIRGLSNE
jgi:hypothetical protein